MQKILFWERIKNGLCHFIQKTIENMSKFEKNMCIKYTSINHVNYV